MMAKIGRRGQYIEKLLRLERFNDGFRYVRTVTSDGRVLDGVGTFKLVTKVAVGLTLEQVEERLVIDAGWRVTMRAVGVEKYVMTKHGFKPPTPNA
jgi:hypothetical protein